MRILVTSPQVPFARGGAEILAERLTLELRERGHETDLVTMPFKWYPSAKVLTHALMWRLADLTEVDGRPIDLVIGTKFPSYVIKHPNKVVWLVHQFRQAYELDGTEFAEFDDSPAHRATRRAIHRLDAVALGEARKLGAISQNVADRLKSNTGLDAEVILAPPQQLNFRCESYDNFFLSVNRLDRAKRIDLLLEAAGSDSSIRCVIAGEGPDRERLEQVARGLGLNGRAVFTGRVSEAELASLYARCRGVYYGPVDEDYGLVPYEAFMAEKPVVTTVDAGGPLDIVHDGKTGLVIEPRADELARVCRFLLEHEEEARSFGRAGRVIAERVTWDHVIDRLLS